MRFVQFDWPWHCSSIFSWLFWWKKTKAHEIVRVFGFRFAKFYIYIPTKNRQLS